MSEAAMLRHQAIGKLNTIGASVRRAIDICGTTKNTSRFPPAYAGVVEALPPFGNFLSSLDGSLQEPSADAQAVERYRAIKGAASDCVDNAQYIEDLLQMFAYAGDWKREYQREVANGKGKLLEQAWKDLLTSAKHVAKDVHLGEEQSMLLQGLLEEANKLPPSLAEEAKSNVTLNQYGEGNQFYHGGRGDQNSCNGGQMITGRNDHAEYSYKTDT
ncbi:hypothetical protein FGRMN_5734 [Fusarium graminum]|nr:hypothetical protein FGRMN_5734 [Fusarium graminum]